MSLPSNSVSAQCEICHKKRESDIISIIEVGIWKVEQMVCSSCRSKMNKPVPKKEVKPIEQVVE